VLPMGAYLLIERGYSPALVGKRQRDRGPGRAGSQLDDVLVSIRDLEELRQITWRQRRGEGRRVVETPRTRDCSQVEPRDRSR
jgi:hypothetical protein